jgi:hypothetical protein
MLTLTLPRDETRGTCEINGEAAEYRIENDEGEASLWFRYAEDGGWDSRRILAMYLTRAPVKYQPERGIVDCICYVCAGDIEKGDRHEAHKGTEE